jgi:hypothetical protein
MNFINGSNKIPANIRKLNLTETAVQKLEQAAM